MLSKEHLEQYGPRAIELLGEIAEVVIEWRLDRLTHDEAMNRIDSIVKQKEVK
jgi:hypothetical protein